MKALKKKTSHAPFLFTILAAWLALANFAWAESDKELQEKALKAREANQGVVDHSAHVNQGAASGPFRGVFYGYLPCREEGCNGLKITLSLNPKNKYLLVSQPAKVLNKETFEKGVYRWDEALGIVSLTPNNDAPPRKFAIKDEGTLLYLSDDPEFKTGNQDRYLLQRSDKAGNREMHIH